MNTEDLLDELWKAHAQRLVHFELVGNGEEYAHIRIRANDYSFEVIATHKSITQRD